MLLYQFPVIFLQINQLQLLNHLRRWQQEIKKGNETRKNQHDIYLEFNAAIEN